MAEANPVRLHALLTTCGPALRGTDHATVEMAATDLDQRLAGYDATTLHPDELGGEWESMIALYRAVRAGHATMQAALRSSDLADLLTRLYYALRSIQGS